MLVRNDPALLSFQSICYLLRLTLYQLLHMLLEIVPTGTLVLPCDSRLALLVPRHGEGYTVYACVSIVQQHCLLRLITVQNPASWHGFSRTLSSKTSIKARSTVSRVASVRFFHGMIKVPRQDLSPHRFRGRDQIQSCLRPSQSVQGPATGPITTQRIQSCLIQEDIHGTIKVPRQDLSPHRFRRRDCDRVQSCLVQRTSTFKIPQQDLSPRRRGIQSCLRPKNIHVQGPATGPITTQDRDPELPSSKEHPRSRFRNRTYHHAG
jgi:hypothetical protein